MTPQRMNRTSLKCTFRRQATRWALLGFLLTTIIAVPCVLYSAKLASEHHLLVTAKSTIRAFRSKLLQNDVREVQFEMRKALELKDEESAIIYDDELKAILPLKDGEETPFCRESGTYCWNDGFKTVSILYPLFFDDQDQSDLFGYLELTLTPTLDLSILSILVFILLAAFIGQAFGLSSALNQSAQQLIDQLSIWASHLRTHPGERPENQKVPFTELDSMQEAVDGLNVEIEKLKEKTALDAKLAAQVEILREIGHDLRTPHSLLARYFALHIDTVRSTGMVKESEVSNVLRTLKRMGELLRQVRTFSFNKGTVRKEQSLEFCNLDQETTLILEDLRNDPDLLGNQITIATDFEEGSFEVFLSKTGLYRILENLIRNASDAMDSSGGHITIKIRNIDGRAALLVQDNGTGIEPAHLDKIFDLDFTTKAGRGTGLGLGIVKKICAEFGAQIHIESTLGVGTSVTILFQSSKNITLVDTDQKEVSYGKI